MSLNILLFEPYFTGSHQSWANAIAEHSNHSIDLFTLTGRYWKFRMQASAIEFADTYSSSSRGADLIIASDMTNVSLLKALLLQKGIIPPPVITYFHENQITYPWSKDDRDIKQGRDHTYGFLNYTNALASDAIWFNSNYHRESFFGSLPGFLKQFPDKLPQFSDLEKKSAVVYPGAYTGPVSKVLRSDSFSSPPVILFNHRWEYDKNPVEFFNILKDLKRSQFAFKLIICGENFRRVPHEFIEAKEFFKEEIIHYGFADSRHEYEALLLQADIAPVTSIHDFFGMSVLEATAGGAHPLLPDRLSYPELFDKKNNGNFFYDSKEELNRKLRQLLQVKTFNRQAVRDIAANYDFEKCVEAFDTQIDHFLRAVK